MTGRTGGDGAGRMGRAEQDTNSPFGAGRVTRARSDGPEAWAVLKAGGGADGNRGQGRASAGVTWRA